MPRQGFTVRVGGAEADIERVSVQGPVVSLALEDGDEVEHGEAVTVAYNPPAAGVLQDALGNTVDAIPANALVVKNRVPDPRETDPPEPVSATVIEDGTVVRVTFDEALTFSLFPPGQVAGLMQTARTDTAITWTWMAPSVIDQQQGLTSYYNYRTRQVGGSWSGVSRTNSPTATLTGLTKKTEYEIQVWAVNAAGPGPRLNSKAETDTNIPDIYAAWRAAGSGNRWRVFRMAGGYGNAWDTGIQGPTTDSIPAGLAFDRDRDDMFAVAQPKVYRMAGGYGNSWDAGIDRPDMGTGFFSERIVDVAFDSSGNLYVLMAALNSSTGHALGRIYRMSGGYSTSGSWDTGIDGAGVPGAVARGIAFDSSDRLYMSAALNTQSTSIFRKANGYSSSGSWDAGISAPGDVNGGIKNIAIDGDDDLYAMHGTRIYRMAGGYGNAWDAGVNGPHTPTFFQSDNGGIAFGPRVVI